MNFDCGIYSITSPSGKRYIGSACSFRKRWSRHRRQLILGTHHCAGLQRAYHKYGLAALVFAKIAIVPRGELIVREQEQIDALPPSMRYNANPVAGSGLGSKRTPEQRARLSAALKGLQKSEDTRQRMSDYAKRRSSVHLAKLAKSLTGKTASAKTRAKQRAAKLGKQQTPEHIAKVRATQCAQIRADNKSGYRGVSRDGARWVARVKTGATYKNLGRFDTPEAANAAIVAYKSVDISIQEL